MNFHIVTFGCQMNVADSDWLARTFRGRGMTESPLGEADVVLVNTCSVREKPELKVRSALGRIHRETAGREVLVGVAGCVAQQLGAELLSCTPQVRLVAGADAVGRIPDAVELLLEHPGKTLCLTDFAPGYEERAVPGTPHSGPAAFVNIMQGCDNFCTYCIVPFTKGRQKSRTAGAVLAECEAALEAGAREITLLGQNVSAYGADRCGDGTSFAELLRKVSALDPTARLRYVTPHPKDMTAEDVELFASLPNLCPRLHLPMQAGSDRVLARMHRRYDSAAFLSLVEDLRAARPDIALSTDLIVGFPGETEDDFLATMETVRKAAFMASFSFCYSDRPGARAAKFADKIAPDVSLDRLQRLQALQEELSDAWLAGRVGRETEVLVEGPSPRREAEAGLASWQGRDPYGALVHVALPDGTDPVGALLRVRVSAAFRHSLRGEAL